MSFERFIFIWACIVAFLAGVVLYLWQSHAMALATLYLLLILLAPTYVPQKFKMYCDWSYCKILFLIIIILCGFLYCSLYSFHFDINASRSSSQNICDSSWNDSWICASRKSMIKLFNAGLPAPEAGLVIGIVIGDTSQMSGKLKNMFRNIGLSHIVAASGSNIVILSSFILLPLSFFMPRRFGLIAIFLVIAAYVAIVGLQAPIIRAAIMAIATIQALLIGRRSSALTSLILVVFLMVIANPFIIRDDLGFQLSFAATFGLIILAPRITEFFMRINGLIRNIIPLGIIETTSVVFSAQLTTLPIVVARFGTPSLLIFPANLLLAPMASYTMIFALVTLVTHPISIVLSDFLAYMTYLSATYMVRGGELMIYFL